MEKEIKYYNPADSITDKPIDFKAVVQAMTAKEIIMNMVESLRKPWVNVSMDNYGLGIKSENGKSICYGCAATNSICQITGAVFSPESLNEIYGRAEFLNTSNDFLQSFEYAIDFLRIGDIYEYNYYAVKGEFALINNDADMFLPVLNDDYTKADLQFYVRLANAQ